MERKTLAYGLFMILIIITVGVAGCVTAENQNTGKECGTCPQLSPPAPDFCKNGTIVAGETNECGCHGPPKCSTNAQMANPASVNCINNGGKLEIVTAADGSQSGMCTFEDGFACEEWAYYRGECPPQRHICTDAEKATEACTMEYLPVCGDNGITYGNDCSACAGNNITLWTHGECPSA